MILPYSTPRGINQLAHLCGFWWATRVLPGVCHASPEKTHQPLKKPRLFRRLHICLYRSCLFHNNPGQRRCGRGRGANHPACPLCPRLCRPFGIGWEGKVALPVPPHHRAYGSVHGGSCEPLHGPRADREDCGVPIVPVPGCYGRVHVRGPGIPPGSRPVAVALRARPTSSPSAISFRQRVLGLRHCSHKILRKRRRIH